MEDSQNMSMIEVVHSLYSVNNGVATDTVSIDQMFRCAWVRFLPVDYSFFL